MSDSEISLDDVAFVAVLPTSWATTNLEQVAALGFGQSPPSSTYNFEGKGLPFFQGKAEFGERYPTVQKWCTEPTRVAEAGDILMSIRAPVGPTNVAPTTCGIGRGLASIRPHSSIRADYILYYLRHIAGRLASKGTGTTFGAITKPVVQGIQIPLAPGPEQLRIVSKVEQLFSHIDEGERALERMKKLVDRYRQSVLKAAVTGELTREWREKDKDKLESGEALLARILNARREAWEKAELAKMKAKGITPANDNWKQKYEEPSPPDSTTLPELPHGWTWTSLESLCPPERSALKAGPFGSALKKSDYSEHGYKIYGQEQVIAGDWSVGDYFIDEAKYQQLESCKVQPFDVLISLVGTIGKVLVLPVDCAPGIINPRLIKVSLNLDVYAPLFFKTYFESAFLKSLYKSESHGATMDVLNMGIIERLPFPLCGLQEQQEIVARCVDAFDKMVRLKDAAVLEKQRSTALRQSVLKSAFCGQLVEQFPSDEPASVLLGRIATAGGTDSAARKLVCKRKTTA